jgi:cysteine-rich repeat protein
MCEQDGLVGEGEACDDDNPYVDDGCTDCQIDDGWGCFLEPSSCYLLCDPLAQDCEGVGLGCYPLNDGEFWACANDVSNETGELGDTCDFLNACDAGLACAAPEHFEFCDDVVGCCTPLCDLSSPSCPIRWTCTSFYDGAPPLGYENVGICAWI